MIAIFTDFGVTGPYLGQMKAALYRQAPGVPVADIFPDLPVFNIKAAASLLPAYSQYLPAQTVCLCVVDPGVGMARRALAVQADGRWYVGPDNGLFTQLLRRADQSAIYAIDWRPKMLSDSFHGRDLFAPIAARLAHSHSAPGPCLSQDVLTLPAWPDDLAEVVYIDTYGNAITGLRAAILPTDTVLNVAGRACAYHRVFGEAPPGEPFWYVNSNGLVEIAVQAGNAANGLGLAVGTTVSW